MLKHEVSIRLNGDEHTHQKEYCISEGWNAGASGRAKDHKGNPLLLKVKGEVEPFYR